MEASEGFTVNQFQCTHKTTLQLARVEYIYIYIYGGACHVARYWSDAVSINSNFKSSSVDGPKEPLKRGKHHLHFRCLSKKRQMQNANT